jgi:hypothetical protein
MTIVVLIILGIIVLAVVAFLVIAGLGSKGVVDTVISNS